MAIKQSEILAFSNRASTPSASLLWEAKRQGRQTAFLCHSHKDRELAKCVQAFLASVGFDLYIDWEDANMPNHPNQETAARIQSKIEELHWFLYLATENSAPSRWCPWEIGYADGVKPTERILILPTEKNYTTYGAEYLGLYRHIDARSVGVPVVVRNLDGTITEMKSMRV
ncbi:MAG: toll/interleukin-1 receptor domain-containing protein [Flavobacteriales bacterium]|nr:toll/interleukin-1 receptor domain-containing protein [Flavobacteriales bacterium]